MSDNSKLDGKILVSLNEAAKLLGVSRRTIERLRAEGLFPEPNKTIGSRPLWRPATLEKWVDAGGVVLPQ